MSLLYRIIIKIHQTYLSFIHRAYIKVCKANGLKLGKDTIARESVSFGSEPHLIEIGDNTRIASGVTFVTHSGATMNIRQLEGYENVSNFGWIKIGNNCAIGANCVILQDVEMGDNCVLGANSVLSSSMPSNTVYTGNPAQYVCEIEEYADVLLKNNIEYNRDLEKDKKKLNRWLKNNLPKRYKKAQ